MIQFEATVVSTTSHEKYGHSSELRYRDPTDSLYTTMSVPGQLTPGLKMIVSVIQAESVSETGDVERLEAAH